MNSRIELTVTSPDATAPLMHRAVTEAIQKGFAAVCISTAWTARVAKMVQGSGVKVCSFVGFPLGMSKSTIKAIEATSTIKDGAEKIEVAAHLPHLMSLDLDASKVELLEIVRAARSTRRDVKINAIVETALLMQTHGEKGIKLACRAVRESGCDGIVTSSGFHSAGGASVESVALLKKHGEALTIKAAGGVIDRAHAEKLLLAGADVVGLSADSGTDF